jgi:predicted sulfurtransferase
VKVKREIIRMNQATVRRELQDRTVVSYCKGGIRCEKAAL